MGERTVSLINGAGKTGQPHAKNKTYIVLKIQLKISQRFEYKI